MATLAAAIGGPDRLAVLAPTLGRRHAAYGVRDGDYATVGTALPATLEDQLGRLLAAETRATWTACCDLLVGTMRNAARTDALAAAM